MSDDNSITTMLIAITAILFCVVFVVFVVVVIVRSQSIPRYILVPCE